MAMKSITCRAWTLNNTPSSLRSPRSHCSLYSPYRSRCPPFH